MPVNESDYQKPAILDRLQHAIEVYQNQGVASGVTAAQDAMRDVNAAPDDAAAYQVELDFRAGEYGPVPDIDEDDPALPGDPDPDPDPDPVPDPEPVPEPEPDPVPAPEPEPDPAPAPEPNPEPDPEPEDRGDNGGDDGNGGGDGGGGGGGDD